MENTYYHPDQETARIPTTFRKMKAIARENLLGNYRYIIIAFIFIQLVGMLINSFFVPTGAQPNIMQYGLYYIATFIISLLMNLFYGGVYAMHLKISRGEAISMADLSYPIKHGTNRFLGVALVMSILSFVVQIPGLFLEQQLLRVYDYGLDAMTGLIITTVLTVIALIVFIVLMLGFAFSYFLLIDNPQMRALEALSTSWKYMKGNKKRLFALILSFFGLWLLSILTCMIAFLWVQPYMEQSMTVFYETIVQQ